MMRVLSVASECAPLVKTGGLADVAGALPAALAGDGVEMRTLLPAYPAVLAAAGRTRSLAKLGDLFGGPARLLSADAAGLKLILLDAPHLFDREGGIYLGPGGKDWPDNPRRYAALCQAAVRIAQGEAGRWRPELIHCHDWQAGLVPLYLRQEGCAVPSVLTIHNIAFHGLAPATEIPALGLDRKDFTQDGYEFWGQVSALKAGLVYADRLTTVSPTYADELMRPEFGMGLEGVMQARRFALSGILNGIDTVAWDPASDPAIHSYRTARGKARNKAALRREFALPEAGGPLCCVVSRLTGQKGLDLLLEALPALVDRGGQLALLGTGDAALETAFREAAAHENVSVRIGYDEELAHRMIAGADAILVPSRFEPCGLTQLYGLRYGTLPLVALTGGLADTVINASPAALAMGVATGLQFHPVSTDALAQALIRLCGLYAQPEIWSQMQRNAMKQPVGWDSSARAYASLFRELTETP